MSTIIDGIDYGPLSPLIGQWIGTRGVDKALQPEPEGMEQTPFIDQIDFKIAGAANNADSQDLVATFWCRAPFYANSPMRLVIRQPVDFNKYFITAQEPRRSGWCVLGALKLTYRRYR